MRHGCVSTPTMCPVPTLESPLPAGLRAGDVADARLGEA